MAFLERAKIQQCFAFEANIWDYGNLVAVVKLPIACLACVDISFENVQSFLKPLFGFEICFFFSALWLRVIVFIIG